MSLTKKDIIEGLVHMGVQSGMTLEVHSSLSSLGYVEGGAQTVIEALQETVGKEGSIFMPELCLSPELPMTEQDKELGLVTKIQILPPDNKRSAMGIIADTFRQMPDVVTGEGTFRISGWGKHASEAVNGLNYAIHNEGRALLIGVDIYKLTAMHYVEDLLPEKIRDIFKPSKKVNEIYPEEKWFVETGRPPVQPWYTIQDMAFEKNLIHKDKIGESNCMFFKIWDVVGLYQQELKNNPYRLYGVEEV